jgi:hypothetical protein
VCAFGGGSIVVTSATGDLVCRIIVTEQATACEATYEHNKNKK